METYQLLLVLSVIILSTFAIIKVLVKKGINIVENKFIVMQDTKMPQVIDKKYLKWIIILMSLIIIILSSIAISGVINMYNHKNINVNQVQNKVDINKASKEELMNLNGIGEKNAESIIKHRPYKNIYELNNIEGIGNRTFEGIKDKIKVE